MVYRLFLSIFSLFCTNNVVAEATPNVVVSIKPIHSIVSVLMENVGYPELLLETNESAHSFYLKPSQIKLIANADLVITIAPNFEEGLTKTLTNTSTESHIILSELNTLSLLNSRESNPSNKVDNLQAKDVHLWLSIENMKSIARHLSERLTDLNTTNKATYESNLMELEAKLDALNADLQQKLAPFSSTNYAVFSDTLQYFERSYKLAKPIIITDFHGSRLSIHQALKSKKQMKINDAKCLFFTIENTPDQVRVLTEGLSTKSERIDILGNRFQKGPEQYFKTMKSISSQVTKCLQ